VVRRIAVPKDDVARFVAALKTNARLQAAVKDGGGDLRSLVALAVAEGHEVTEAAVEAYLRTHQAEIRDEQLDAVVGGILKRPVEGMFGTIGTGTGVG
jgi:hypothetical protein